MCEDSDQIYCVCAYMHECVRALVCVCREDTSLMYLLEEHYQEVVDDKVGRCTEMV